MLSVILTILKIIGIILLVILGLLLTVALIVLFVPIRYKSAGSFAKTDGGIKDNVLVRVTWLLHIVSVTFRLKDTEPELVIKIFGKKLSLYEKNADKAEKNKEKHKGVLKTKVTAENNTEAKAVEKVSIETDKIANDTNTAKSSETVTKTTARTKVEEYKKEAVVEISEDNKENKKKEKVKVKKSFKEKITDILNKIDSICQKIKNIKAIKDSFIEYLKRDESKLAIKEIKHIIFKVLKHILPKRLWARIKFGFEDPSTTGNILGVASVFYGVYGEHLELEPDFENVVLEGEYKLKGRIRVFTLLIAAWKIYRNRWLRKFIAFSKKTVKKILNSE